jgi:hypothetical protein
MFELVHVVTSMHAFAREPPLQLELPDLQSQVPGGYLTMEVLQTDFPVGIHSSLNGPQ